MAQRREQHPRRPPRASTWVDPWALPSAGTSDEVASSSATSDEVEAPSSVSTPWKPETSRSTSAGGEDATERRAGWAAGSPDLCPLEEVGQSRSVAPGATPSWVQGGALAHATPVTVKALFPDAARDLEGPQQATAARPQAEQVAQQSIKSGSPPTAEEDVASPVTPVGRRGRHGVLSRDRQGRAGGHTDPWTARAVFQESEKPLFDTELDGGRVIPPTGQRERETNGSTTRGTSRGVGPLTTGIGEFRSQGVDTGPTASSAMWRLGMIIALASGFAWMQRPAPPPAPTPTIAALGGMDGTYGRLSLPEGEFPWVLWAVVWDGNLMVEARGWGHLSTARRFEATERLWKMAAQPAKVLITDGEGALVADVIRGTFRDYPAQAGGVIELK